MIFEWHLERYFRTAELFKKLNLPLPKEISVAHGIDFLSPMKRLQEGVENKAPIHSAFELQKMFAKKYIPIVENCALYTELLKNFEKYPSQLSSFEALNPWEKLEFLELYFGLTTSHTTLEFQPIDFAHHSP